MLAKTQARLCYVRDVFFDAVADVHWMERCIELSWLSHFT